MKRLTAFILSVTLLSSCLYSLTAAEVIETAADNSEIIEVSAESKTEEEFSKIIAAEETDYPKSIKVGNNENVVQLIDYKETSYWKVNDTQDGIVEASSDDYNLMYDGKDTLTFNNFNMECNGNFVSADYQTSALIGVDSGTLNIVFHGKNRLESTGGASYFRHALRGENTFYKFIGDEDATLEFVSGPNGLSTPALSAGIVCDGFDLMSGTVICDGTKVGGNGIEVFGSNITVYGGKLITKGASEAVWMQNGTINTENNNILASTDVNGTNLGEYISGDHSSYKYIEITAGQKDPIPDPVPEIKIVYGGAGGSENLSAADATFILQKVLISTYRMPIEELTDDYMAYCDVNCDGALDAADSTMVLQKVLISTYQMPIEKE